MMLPLSWRKRDSISVLRVSNSTFDSMAKYKNGREVRDGDRVVVLNDNGHVLTGIIHSVSGDDNALLAPISRTDPAVNPARCIHVDDIKAAFPDLEDSHPHDDTIKKTKQ